MMQNIYVNVDKLLKNGIINVEEYNRISSLYEEATMQMVQYRKILENQFIRV